MQDRTETDGDAGEAHEPRGGRARRGDEALDLAEAKGNWKQEEKQQETACKAGEENQGTKGKEREKSQGTKGKEREKNQGTKGKEGKDRQVGAELEPQAQPRGHSRGKGK